jgi:hypothetical protein
MEEYGKILLIAMPLFLLIILEKMYGAYKGEIAFLDGQCIERQFRYYKCRKRCLRLALLLFPMVGWFLNSCFIWKPTFFTYLLSSLTFTGTGPSYSPSGQFSGTNMHSSQWGLISLVLRQTIQFYKSIHFFTYSYILLKYNTSHSIVFAVWYHYI